VKNSAARQLVSIAFYPGLFLACIWVVFLIQQVGHYNVSRFGISPRDPGSLTGIITSVFVHGDLDHIASNSLPLLVLGMLLFYFYRNIAIPVCLWIWLTSGIWLWVGGRNNAYGVYHIGASTLIYGFATFLFFSGVFRRHTQLMFISALVVFLYGSIVWGMFPIKPEMSWEGHLFGAIAGVLVAFNYRKEGPQRRVYEWESEEEIDDQTDLNGEISSENDPLNKDS
jgi:membrane associated rhomboid family serine protease